MPTPPPRQPARGAAGPVHRPVVRPDPSIAPLRRGDTVTDPTTGRRRPRAASREVPAAAGLVVEDVETGWCGAVVRVEKAGGVHVVVLEDWKGRTRSFPLGAGFLEDGAPVRLVPPVVSAVPPSAARGPIAPGRTASGSFAVAGQRARVARGSRIWVEGKHDAELVEKVWGDDLRVEGVVVEGLQGVDHLAAALAEFRPGPGRRVGVLVDHLITGTKETRLVADAVRGVPGAAEHVLVVGHPYVDVWQAVRPGRLGMAAWPVIPRGRSWKEGVLEELGWPRSTPADLARGWQRVLGSVRTIADLEPTLSGRVEELIDFVTGDQLDG